MRNANVAAFPTRRPNHVKDAVGALQNARITH